MYLNLNTGLITLPKEGDISDRGGTPKVQPSESWNDRFIMKRLGQALSLEGGEVMQKSNILLELDMVCVDLRLGLADQCRIREHR